MRFPMHRSSSVIVAITAIVGASLLSSCADSSASMRDMSKFQVNQVPTVVGQPLPTQWAAMFNFAMTNAPILDLDDPQSIEQIKGLVRQVPWIDPSTVAAHLAMPDGVRVYYRALIPVLVIRQSGRAVGLLSKEGRALPPGFNDDQLSLFLNINIPEGVELPSPGDSSSAGLLQEAVRIFPEVDQLKALTRLNIVAIQQQADYRATESEIVPPLTFVTADGLEIEWGRSVYTPDPFSVDANERPLTIERKGFRLSQLMKQFPNLVGVGRVVLDDPLVKVFDRQGKPMALKNDIL
jgi:hypothetical protein